MAETLRIDIGANIKPLQDGLNNASNAIKKFGDGTGKYFGNAGGAIELARDKVKRLETQILALNAEGLKSTFGKGLITNLQLAQLETKKLEASAGLAGQSLTNGFSKAYGAVRQLAYALPGVGIGTIFGLALNPLIEYTQKLFGATQAEDEFNKAIEGSSTKVADNAGKVTLLTLALESNALKGADVERAQKQLIKLAPEFTGSFDKAGKAIKDLNPIFDAYITKQIEVAKAQAVLQAVQKIIAENINTIAVGGNQGFAKILGQFGGLLDITGSLRPSITATAQGLKADNVEAAQAALKIENLKKVFDDLFKSLNIDKTSLFTNFLDSFKEDKITNKTKTIKDLTEKVKELKKAFLELPSSEAKLDAFNGPTVKGKAIGTPLVTNFSADFLQAQALFLKLQESAKKTADIFNSTLGPAISSAFTAAIEGSKSFGQAFTQALRGIVVQLIATIAKALILAAILTATGFSKLGFGKSFTSLLGGGKGFAGGGVASGPSTGYLALLHGTEAIFNESQMKALAGLISGGGQQTFIADNKLSGEDLYTSFIRVAQRRGRNF